MCKGGRYASLIDPSSLRMDQGESFLNPEKKRTKPWGRAWARLVRLLLGQEPPPDPPETAPAGFPVRGTLHPCNAMRYMLAFL